MNPLQRLLRGWLDVDEQKHDGRKTARNLAALTDQLATLQGLIHHQTDVTLTALRHAGWQSEDDVAQTQAIQRALTIARGDGDVIVGPWTGEVGFELLYWIPFLNWLVEQGLDPSRLVVVSRGGAAPWYRHLTTRYVDVLDLLTPEEFRERTAEGKRKQYSPSRDLDRELLDRIREDHGLRHAKHIHPAAMFRLFLNLFRERASLDVVDAFTSFRFLAPVEEAEADIRALPSDYIVAKFYFSKPFPDTPENHAFVRDLLQRVSARVPVVLLSTSVRLDDHHDFAATAASGIHIVDAHREPQKNLDRQTRIIAGARGFLGTYGGFSYLAPFYGVRSVSFFSRRTMFKPHHLELADRVFDRLLPGGFLAMERHAIDLVMPAVEQWTRRAGSGQDALAGSGKTPENPSGRPDIRPGQALA